MSDATDQRQRVTRLVAWRQAATVARPSDYFDVQGAGIEILGGDLGGGTRGTRTAYKIKKTSDKSPNTCEVTLYNLAPTTRAALVRRPTRVQLHAGYLTTGARLLFVGDVKPGSASTLNGSTWETKLLLGDGIRAFGNARVDRSYRAGTEVRTIIRDAALSLGLDLPADVLAASGLATRTITGEIAHGWAADELTRLLAPYGYTWSIQDGRLQVLQDQVARAEVARVVSPETGMIGSPTIGTPDEKGNPPNTRVKMSLYNEMTPGGRVQVVSRHEGSGTYRIVTVEHTGDTDGGDWQTELEMKAI